MSSRLIVLIYAPMLMGKRQKSGENLSKEQVNPWFFPYLHFTQYAVPLLLTALDTYPVFGVSPLFGTIVEQGVRRPWNSRRMAAVFEELKWMDGASLSVTSATIGLVFGVLGGIVLINMAHARDGPLF